ncbi:MAG TPA: LysR family transcriptional regulator [Rhizomicrobium sp.]|nr:LysR family transcriptional regulator [Rhizomicrobium sp.]
MKQNFTVRQGALDGVEAFLSVARHKSFRRAAAELGVTPSAISQTVRALEARIGAALFIRTTRSVGMSEAGERFLERAKPAFEELTAAARAAQGLGSRPAGLLRLTVPRAVVPILLEPLLASFARAYPGIELEIDSNEKLVDLAAEGFDAGMRLGQFISADMVAIRMSPPFPLTVVASPDYLKRRGRPERIEDLRDHACLRLRRSGGAIAPWTFASGNKRIEAMVSGPFIANDLPTLLSAARQGLGLAQVPGPTARKLVTGGKLVPMLEPFAPMAPGVFLYYPARRQMPPKLRAFIDHVKSRQSVDQAADDGSKRTRPRGKAAR